MNFWLYWLGWIVHDQDIWATRCLTILTLIRSFLMLRFKVVLVQQVDLFEHPCIYILVSYFKKYQNWSTVVGLCGLFYLSQWLQVRTLWLLLGIIFHWAKYLVYRLQEAKLTKKCLGYYFLILWPLFHLELRDASL